MKLFLDNTIDSYRLFLKIKALPRYAIHGHMAEFPDEYAALLGVKLRAKQSYGYEPPSWMFDYQAAVSRLAIKKRKFACFIDCGFGKTHILLEFMKAAEADLGSHKNCLIISPLMVIKQTLAEANKFYEGKYQIEQIKASKLQEWLREGRGIGITNYEAITQELDIGRCGAVGLDESSLLKSHYGKWGTKIIDMARGLEWKISMTGTPAPNDRIEYANQAIFLDQFPTVNSFLAKFFVNKGQTSERWILKPHAMEPFYRALSHWSIFLTNPATYGWKDNCGNIPPIKVNIHDVDLTQEQHDAARLLTGDLFATAAGGITSRIVMAQLAKGSYKGQDIRTKKPGFIRDLLKEWDGKESTIVWCRFNAEQERLAKMLPNAASISGDTPIERRQHIIDGFKEGRIPTIISKPKILGFGLNLQVATRQVFSTCHDCYDEDTEILTIDGWRRFDDVSVGQQVATVNPDGMIFEWQPCTKVVWEPYKGKMVVLNGMRNFNLLVTPNHKLLVHRCQKRFPSGENVKELKYADDVAKTYRRQEYRMFSCTEWFGNISDFPVVKIPPCPPELFSPRSAVVRTMPPNTFAKLCGWFVSEGYCRPVSSKEFGRIVLCQTEKNPDNRLEIISILESLNLSVNSNTKDITTYSRNLAWFLMKEFGAGSANKKLPQWIKNYSSVYLVTLRDTMLKGDGCQKNGVFHCYRTISKQLADDFQEICLKTGVRASIHQMTENGKPSFYVSLAWKNTNPSIHRKPEIVDYEGMIGCVTVDKYHTIIVRRRGIPVVCGQSYEEYYQAVKRSNRVGSRFPLNVHIPITELERPMMENVLNKASMVERDTVEQERVFKKFARIE